jgi:hypothetical protein
MLQKALNIMLLLASVIALAVALSGRTDLLAVGLLTTVGAAWVCLGGISPIERITNKGH